MEHLVINTDICDGCGFCTVDCPMGIVALNNKKKAIHVAENEEICLYCGHCVTVCPVQAIELNPITDESKLSWIKQYGIIPLSLKPGECLKVERNQFPEVKKLENLIRARRMTRSFLPKLVDHDLIEHIFNDTLCYHPSGHNIRGLNLKIVEGRDKINELTDLTCDCFKEIIKKKVLHQFDQKVYEKIVVAWEEHGINRIFRTAQQVAIVHIRSDINDVLTGPSTISLLTYFEILANSMGLGTVYAGYFAAAASTYEPIQKYLGIPAGNKITSAMMFGYSAVNYNLIPKRPEIKIAYV